MALVAVVVRQLVCEIDISSARGGGVGLKPLAECFLSSVVFYT